MNPSKETPANSPCIKKCSLNKDRICINCFRTIEEIAAWPDADNKQRKKILERLALRKLSK